MAPELDSSNADEPVGEPGKSSGDLIPPAALAQVPGYLAALADSPGAPAVELSSLPGGTLNRSFAVRTPSGRFVLRVSPGADAWLAADRSIELALHACAARARLAPRIVAVDAAHRWLVTEFIAGPTWSAADFAQAPRLAVLGDTLRALHALPTPAGAHLDVLGTLATYAERIRVAAASSDDVSEYVRHAAEAWAISGAASRPAAILHHDLHASNLLDGERGLTLIDWECAAVADPLLDVACVLSYYQAARPHADTLLDHAGFTSIGCRQVDAAVWLFDLHTLCWYRERRTRRAATPAEIEAEGLLAVRVARGYGEP